MTSEDKVYNYNHVEPTEEDPLRQREQNEKDEKETFRKKISNCLANITIEPSLFFFVISIMIIILTSQNLYLDKACRVNLNYTDEICDSLRLQTMEIQSEYERETQKLLAKALTWKTYITATVPCFISLFVGSFSDRTGHRKFFLLMSFVGQFALCMNNIINVYFFRQLNLAVLVFSEATFEALSGALSVCFLAAFAYISAITTNETRTYRMGIVSLSITAAFPIGIGVSGYLLKKIGYYGCYGVSSSIHVLNFLYIFFMVKDPPRNKEQKKHDRKGVCYLIREFFKLSNAKATLTVILKKAPNNRRMRLCILLLVVSVLFGPMYGEISIMYMATRYRFGWDEIKYSMFQTYNFVAHTIGTVFSLTVFSKWLKWHDSLLGIVSTLSKIAASFVFCFAPNEKIFFIGPLVEILNGTSLLAMRSIITKLVETDELGKISSMISLVENLMPLIYVPLYTKVYTATMDVLPGAVFLMGASMTVPAVATLCWLFYDHRKQLRISRNTMPVEKIYE